MQEHSIVVPGDELAQGMDFLPANGTFRDEDKIVATRLGLVHYDNRLVKIIPLSGRYSPKRGDTIIGRVIDVTVSGWRIETNSAYSAMLSLKDGTSDFVERGSDLTKYYCIGDWMVTTIINVTTQKLIDLSMKGPGLRKLESGRIIRVNPMKVPRIIGKKGSMVKMIRDATGCRILVGQNGVIWLRGEDPAMEIKAVETIKKIEAEAHKAGLTDEIERYLGQGSNGNDAFSQNNKDNNDNQYDGDSNDI